jgi:hypothetical protein
MRVHGHRLTKLNANRIALELKSQHQTRPVEVAHQIEVELDQNPMQVDPIALVPSESQVKEGDVDTTSMVAQLIKKEAPLFVINVKGVDNEIFV